MNRKKIFVLNILRLPFLAIIIPYRNVYTSRLLILQVQQATENAPTEIQVGNETITAQPLGKYSIFASFLTIFLTEFVQSDKNTIILLAKKEKEKHLFHTRLIMGAIDTPVLDFW